jgi:hypothetical protein
MAYPPFGHLAGPHILYFDTPWLGTVLVRSQDKLLWSRAYFGASANDRTRNGKDNKLIVWQLLEEDEQSMSVVLPVDIPPEPRKQPWILHMLEVNTMNFCSFAWASIESSALLSDDAGEELLIAVPNTLSSESVSLVYPVCTHARTEQLPG